MACCSRGALWPRVSRSQLQGVERKSQVLRNSSFATVPVLATSQPRVLHASATGVTDMRSRVRREISTPGTVTQSPHY